MTRTRSAAETTRTQTSTMTLTQRAAAIVGAVFALIGLAGFIPGLTQNLDAISWAGNESNAKLLGLFDVSVLHNLVHLGYGILGLAAARAQNWARTFLIWGGAIYVGLGIYGMVIDRNSDANFVPLNIADNWLHLGLGMGMVGLGLLASATRPEDRPAQSSL